MKSCLFNHRNTPTDNSLFFESLVYFKGPSKAPQSVSDEQEISLESSEQEEAKIKDYIAELIVKYNLIDPFDGRIDEIAELGPKPTDEDLRDFESSLAVLISQATQDNEARRALLKMASEVKKLSALREKSADKQAKKTSAKANPKATTGKASKSSASKTTAENSKADEINELAESRAPFEKLNLKISAYNALVRSERHIRWRKRILLPEYKTKDQFDTQKTIANIEELLGMKRPDLTENEERYLKHIKAELLKIEATAAYATEQKERKVDPKYARKQGERLVELAGGVERSQADLERWVGKDVYIAIDNAYDSAVVGNDQFKALRVDALGNIDVKQARENKQLFMATMESLTEGFTKDLSASVSSSEDLPSLYKSWMEIKSPGLLDKINDYEERLAHITHKVKLKDIYQDAGKYVGSQFSAIQAIPKKPNVNYWHTRVGNLEKDILMMKVKIQEVGEDSDIGGKLRVAVENMKPHLKQAQLSYSLARSNNTRKGIEAGFNPDGLREKKNQKNLIEAHIIRFKEAIESVEGQGLHPSVRRSLIAYRLRNGVGHYIINEYGNRVYKDTPSKSSEWAQEQIASSKYFDQKVRGRSMGQAERVVLEVAHLGGRVANELEDSKQIIVLIDGLMALPKLSKKEGIKKMNELGAPFTPEEIQAYSRPEDMLDAKKKQIIADNVKRTEFLAIAHEVIQNPYDDSDPAKPNAKLIDLNKKGYVLADNIAELTLLKPHQLAEVNTYLKRVESSYNVMDLESRVEGESDEAEILDRMGINVTNIFGKYQQKVLEDSSLNVRNWEEMMSQNGNASELAALLENIIPNGSTAGLQDGKTALLTVLRSMDEPTSDLKLTQHRKYAKKVVRKIAEHIKHQEAVMSSKARAMSTIKKKLKGSSLGDDVEDVIGNVYDMAFGPGPILTMERASGVIAMYAAYKLLQKARKLDGTTGKIAAGGIGLLALNTILKRVNGKSGLEYLGLNTLGEAAEGTHEEALAQHGAEHMQGFKNPKDNISPEEHRRALFALNKAPFHKVMAWYESSDLNGSDYMASPSKNAELSLFAATGIDTNDIIQGSRDRDNKDIRSRFIMRESLTHFFKYVAEKEGKTEENSRKGVNERWVKTIEDPYYVPQYSDYYFPEMHDQYNGKQDEITFGYVMEAEITAWMVEDAIGKNGLAPTLDAAGAWGDKMEDWARRGIINPGEGYAQELLGELGEFGDETAEYLDNLANETAVKIQFAAEEVKIAYKNHEWEIKRLKDGVWGIFTSGVTLPVKLVYGGLNKAIPWVDTKMRQGVEILRSDSRVAPVNPDTGFGIADVSGTNAYVTGNGNLILDSNNRPVLNRNTSQNPQFAHYGLFQPHFAAAMNNLENKATAGREGAKYYAEADGAAYHIVEVNHLTGEEKDHINMQDPLFEDPSNRRGHMQALARSEAVKFYVSKGMKKSYVEKYMYPIHTVFQGKPKEAEIVAFRVPKPDSVEGILKVSGQWVDSMNPNDYKLRAPVMFDASDTNWEKIKKSSGLKYDKGRKAFSFAGRYGIQAIYMWRASMEALGYTAEYIVQIPLAKENEYKADWIGDMFEKKEKSGQRMDEMSTAAMSPTTATSTFYQDKENAAMYKLALEYAWDNDQDVYLGFFKNGYALDKKGKKIKIDDVEVSYEGVIEEKPTDYNKVNFESYYREVWLAEKGHEPIKRFDTYMASVDSVPLPQ